MRGKLCGQVLHGAAVVLPAAMTTSDATPPSALTEAWILHQKAKQQQSPTSRKPRVAYVAPIDVHYRDLTIGETLFYAARLTLPYACSDEDVQSRCLEMAKLFGLEAKLSTYIDSTSLSRLDLRFLSLAEALMSPADALLLEDPMRDLDALQCLAAAAALHDVARSASIAVVYPLHGAVDAFFSYCDRAIMLRKGALLYEGDATYCMLASYSLGLFSHYH
jgi:ABC-type multidrug transport system ATPase subunit